MFYKTIIYLFFIFLFSIIDYSNATGIQIGGSRIIYNENDTQTNISINNLDNTPYLIQSWVNKKIDIYDNNETFITTPPLFRLDPYTQNSIRIIYTGKPLPQNIESVYWLNIKIIPSTNRNITNALLLSVKNRMKIFYRPNGIIGDVTKAYQKLKFIKKNNLLYIYNPTPFSVSLYDVKINNIILKKPPMVLPKHEIPLNISVFSDTKICWRAINDFGGIYPEKKINL